MKDPEGTINSLIESLSLPRRGMPINVSKMLGDVAVYEHHQTVSVPPNTSTIGKGRDSLDKNSKNKLAKILNKELVRSGYQEL